MVIPDKLYLPKFSNSMDIPCISFFQEYAGEMCIVVLRRNKLFLLQHWPTDANSYGVTTLGDHTVKRQPKPFWG
jgi:hypothetical protein